MELGQGRGRGADRPGVKRRAGPGKPPPAPVAPRPPWLALDGAAEAATPAWLERAGWIVAGLGGLLLLWLALARHPIGDYYTESDFYGGYVDGARQIQRGHIDPTAYAVVGPGYEVLLALVGLVIRDFYLAARLISVAAGFATLALWNLLIRRRAGAPAGVWTAALLAVNWPFVRYGYSATTDMLAAALQAASLFLIFAARGRRAPLLAGAVSALAVLTRYSSVYLIPAALLGYAWRQGPQGLSRRRAALLYIAGLVVISAPWIGFSLAHRSVPGAGLVQYFSFYANPEATRNVQDRPGGLTTDVPGGQPLSEVLKGGRGAFLLRLMGNVPDHLVRYGRELLGWPAAALLLAGMALVAFAREGRRLLPVWATGGILFVLLIPVFYSDRYSLPLVPFLLTFAAVFAASPRFAILLGRPGIPLKSLIAVAMVILTLRSSLATQRFTAGMAPLEVLEAGPALARVARPGERVLSRKGHIGYYAGLAVVPFPRFDSLAALAAFSRARGASYLYYSWYEARLRPEFAYLLDTTAAVPGLERIFYTDHNPGVVYRLGPRFGADPPWRGDRVQSSIHYARALARVLPDSLAEPYRLLLGALAMDQGRPQEALEMGRLAVRGRPYDARGWLLAGQALRALGQTADAEKALATAHSLDPGDVATNLELGWVALAQGDSVAAARAWRLTIGGIRDPATLRELERVFARVGDAEALRALAAAAADSARRMRR